MKNKMTKELNISSRLRLQNNDKEHINKNLVVKKVSDWIKEDPLTLWKATREKGVKLVRNAHFELKKAIAVKHPEVIIENEERKSKREAIARVHKRLGLVKPRSL
jgi:hypothetical protein